MKGRHRLFLEMVIGGDDHDRAAFFQKRNGTVLHLTRRVGQTRNVRQLHEFEGTFFGHRG